MASTSDSTSPLVPPAETFTHTNGLVTTFTRYGSTAHPRGHVFYLHGLPSSRLEAQLFAPAAQQLNVQLIALDRPGVGGSTPQPGRRLTSYPPLVAELAAHLELSSFYILGSSAGGPYVLACAQALPPAQLRGVGVGAGVAPVAFGQAGMAWAQRFAICATQWVPGVGLALYDWFVVPAMNRLDEKTVDAMVRRGVNGLGKREGMDRERCEEAMRAMVLAMAAAFAQGTKGLKDEWRNFVGEWGFELREVQCPVTFWVGSRDAVCPVEGARKMAAAVPGGNLVICEGLDHSTLFVEKCEEILARLVDG